ncbi:MAG TPA: S-adenosylmethionine synthetase N-terminal domain-containing protein, partial [Acholeplasmataceae bacterium]|nr:S-adenosylmethionine synthetase N-terminal domain-containing protein [Acholeplasmataceae bacterium]
MHVITSESVFSGHPDKVCDQISDAILDAILEQDKNARVAIETAIKDDLVFVFGEVTTTAKVDYKNIAKRKLYEIGYEDNFLVMEKISRQSPDIALGVDSNESQEQGAGDQGIMYGYACNETRELMPLPIMLANRLSQEIDKSRKEQYSHIFGP